jgi:DNA-binding transcriptional LysR family regulator
MELRHLRYFVAVAEERSFVQAARRLRVAQPALSKQVRALEMELGLALFDRLPRGVRLTRPGEAFLGEARRTLDAAERAVTSARGAAEAGASDLEFAHDELTVYASVIEDLLATFRDAHPEAQLRVTSKRDSDTYTALRERQLDVASVFVAQWPVAEFDALRLMDCASTGVLLPASHPLAAQSSVRLADLRDLLWVHSSTLRWPGFFRTIDAALRERGLVPLRRHERAPESPGTNVRIAAGEAWALANDVTAARFRRDSSAIVYRPFIEPPIACWLVLVWRPKAARLVQQLVEVARTLNDRFRLSAAS